MGKHAPVPPSPIAVVGMACRVPGADGPSAFWRLLLDEVCSVQDAPATRFGRPYGVPGARVRTALLDDVDRFDAEFFGISPREAAGMDPQARLFLETVWEALEDAGQDTSTLAGTRTGVYVGTTNVHYWELQQAAGHPDIHASLGGGSRSTTTGRVSFALDLTGPGLSVDTACSSSLTAIALACQSLQSGESTAAIAGGSQLLLTNTENHGFVDAGVFSERGCRFGDASADGFVFSEGVGAVFLKPLAQALADGDPVHAVIRGWAVNNDGASSGSMIDPALRGQQQMLRQAYAHAGVATCDVDYVEAHGTGTRAGDPVELGAIASVLGARPADRPLLVGSVKSNIGHTGAAAGVLGLIKAALCLRHRTVPRSLHVTERTPAVDWDAAGLDIPLAARPLDAQGRPLAAGVSGFGISGTNVHIVLTEAGATGDGVRRPSGTTAAESGSDHLLALSAASPEALEQRVRDMAHHLGPQGAGPLADVADICHTAAVRRAHHDHRVAVVGDSHETLAARLREALAEGGRPAVAERAQVAFVFSGHGSQWIGMGRELMDASPAFRAALDRCDKAVAAETGWSVVERLTDGSDLVGETVAVVHPVLWAVQVSLAETWRAWGVAPDVVIGHSMGESAAACVAGALSLADAASVVCRRGRLIRDRAAGRGTMSVAALTEAEAEQLIADLGVNVSVAAGNGPRTTVFAGDVAGIEKIKAELDARDVFCRVMKAEAASHCAQMDPLLDELAEALKGITPRTGRIPLRSTVTGELLDGSQLDASYWTRNLRGRVRFREAVLSTAEQGETVFIEVSPHPLLLGAITDTLADAGLPGSATGSLVRGAPERETLLAALAQAYEAGVAVDWNALYGGGRCVPLPSYPWQRESHWVEDLDALPRFHEFPVAAEGSVFLADPASDGPAVVHGPEFLEAARAAAARAAGETATVVLTGVDIEDALVVRPGDTPVLRVGLTAAGAEGSWEFEVASRAAAGEGEWIVRGTGTASVVPGSAAAAREPLADLLARCPEHRDADAFYRGVPKAEGLRRVLEEIWVGQGEAVARLRRPDALEPRPGHPVHPDLVRSAYQPALALLPEVSQLTPHVAEFTVTGPSTQVLWSTCRITQGADGLPALDVALLDAQERVVAEAKGMPLAPRAHEATEDDKEKAAAMPDEHTRAPEPAGPRSAGRGADTSADRGLELTGELRLTDPSSGFVIELRGSLRVSTAAPAGPAPVPARASAPVRAAVPAPAVTPAEAPVPVPVPEQRTDTTSDERPMLDRVAEHVAAVLRMRVAKLDVNKPFQKLGMDSLMATELRKRLERELGVALPASRLPRGTTTAALAHELEAHTAV